MHLLNRLNLAKMFNYFYDFISGVRRRRRRCRQPFSNTNISEASKPIAIKFYLKHHWGGGKAAWSFGGDQLRTLVSMATDRSHRVIMGKTTSSRFLECF